MKYINLIISASIFLLQFNNINPALEKNNEKIINNNSCEKNCIKNQKNKKSLAKSKFGRRIRSNLFDIYNHNTVNTYPTYSKIAFWGINFTLAALWFFYGGGVYFIFPGCCGLEVLINILTIPLTVCLLGVNYIIYKILNEKKSTSVRLKKISAIY